MPVIDLAPGAEDVPLAIPLSGLLRDNLAKRPRLERDFRALRAAVQVVAEDTGDVLTLRFDLGRLTIHAGSVGVPSVTVCGPEATLLRLPDVPFSRLSRRKTSRNGEDGDTFLGLLASGAVKVYGLASHPRLLLRLRRLVARS
jgi:hypothetical protein